MPMSETDLLRASRDGDQFHCYWAARRCLGMLLPATSLVAISVEGASSSELPGGEAVTAGEQVIDLAEYYGSKQLAEAKRVLYQQLKHSAVRTDQRWTLSELERTLSEFGKRFVELKQLDPGLAAKAGFRVISNRRHLNDTGQCHLAVRSFAS